MVVLVGVGVVAVVVVGIVEIVEIVGSAEIVVLEAVEGLRWMR